MSSGAGTDGDDSAPRTLTPPLAHRIPSQTMAHHYSRHSRRLRTALLIGRRVVDLPVDAAFCPSGSVDPLSAPGRLAGSSRSLCVRFQTAVQVGCFFTFPDCLSRWQGTPHPCSPAWPSCRTSFILFQLQGACLWPLRCLCETFRWHMWPDRLSAHDAFVHGPCPVTPVLSNGSCIATDLKASLLLCSRDLSVRLAAGAIPLAPSRHRIMQRSWAPLILSLALKSTMIRSPAIVRKKPLQRLSFLSSLLTVSRNRLKSS